MPCWEINIISVEFKVQNKNLLLDALKSLGYSFNVSGNRISFTDELGRSFTIDIDKQKVTMERDGFETINKVKRAYSKSVMEKIAKNNKWTVRHTSITNKYKLVRY